ncbi:MAG: family 78 glycoside hydrolase catalytic domain, partial [Bacteroidales bacterium]|nr:family 78 glycoside hydrolase catalytic domain [Bacteroidales bacterium]
TVTYGDGKSKELESPVQHFEISLLDRSDWHARWIGRDYPDDKIEGHTVVAARYLRKEFQLRQNIDHARLYISGLGQYQAFFNGQEVAPDELMKPALSDYTRRVYFNAYDVTDLLQEGDNAVGVILAPGRFTTVRHDTNYLEWCGINHAAHYGRPQLLMQLEVFYKDGTADTIVSGEGWRITNRGPIRKANEFDGETFDQHLDVALGAWLHPDYDDSQWQDATVDYDRQNMNLEDRFNPRWKRRDDKYDASMPFPDSAEIAAQRLEYELTPQPNPNIRVMERLTPKSIFRKGDKWILDMGQNMVGVLQVNDISSLLAKKGDGTDTITFRYAELLAADSTLYIDNLRSAECTDRYIAFAKYELPWHPQFVYHGFRYVEISGLPEGSKPVLSDFTGLVLYDQMASISTFETDNPVINAVHRNAFWGIRGNYHSMPTDCPQRDERMGWTGDRTTGCYGESFLFDNHRLYAKWLQDLEDCQWPNGQLSDVAPAYWRNYTDNMTWPGAFITVADMLYTRFGDIEPIRRHYDAMRKWLLHMRLWYCKEGIMTRDCYGDWCMPPESPEMIHSKDPSRITEAAAISTPFYCYLCNIMKSFAIRLGKDDDADFFQQEFDTITAIYNSRYLDTITGNYANGTVTANILPLWFGMVPNKLEDKVFANIINKTNNDFGGHVSTGVVGIQQLMRTLTHYGRSDLALHLATDTTYPSWGYMARRGATTIWELWNGDGGGERDLRGANGHLLASMNSANHVMLLGDLLIWEYEYLAGIRALEPGYSKIQLRPTFVEGLNRVDCTYRSVSGTIESHWRRTGNGIEWTVVIPPNTTAEVHLPSGVKSVGSGRHKFKVKL